MQAMIFAAGLGTRLKPITDHIPKAMVEVGGQPLLRRVISCLDDAGADRIVINVHHLSDQITDYLKANHNFGLDIRVSDETQALLETGGGLKKAAPLFRKDEPILIHNCDILSNVDLRKFYQNSEPVGATLLVSWRKTKRYLLFDQSMRLVGWTNLETGEVRTPYSDVRDKVRNVNPGEGVYGPYNMYAFSGIHTFSPALFRMMDSYPDRFPIMDFYLDNCDKADIRGVVKNDLRLMDVGKQDTLAEAEKFLKTL